MNKEIARKHIRTVLKNISTDEFSTKSEAACRSLCATVEFQQARAVMMFLSIPNEIDTTYAINLALAQQKTVLVPTIVWEQRQIVPVVLTDLDCEMQIDRYGIREPITASPFDASQIDLVITPGLGFDRSGRRIGRGGGFYDRFFERMKSQPHHLKACGFAFQEQVISLVPTNTQDVPVDMLVTDMGVWRFNGKTTP